MLSTVGLLSQSNQASARCASSIDTSASTAVDEVLVVVKKGHGISVGDEVTRKGNGRCRPADVGVAEEHVGVPADQARIDVVEGVDLGQALDLAEVVPVRLHLGLDLSRASGRQMVLQPGYGGDLLGMEVVDVVVGACVVEMELRPVAAQHLREDPCGGCEEGKGDGAGDQDPPPLCPPREEGEATRGKEHLQDHQGLLERSQEAVI